MSATELEPLAAAACSADPVECEDAVIAKIRIRRAAGRNKYMTTMERRDLTKIEWMQHAQEEAMDLAIYLERLMREERQNAKSQAESASKPTTQSTP